MTLTIKTDVTEMRLALDDAKIRAEIAYQLLNNRDVIIDQKHPALNNRADPPEAENEANTD
jgi:hypothetical protein